MAIIIPSNKIFSISNDKVIDNQIKSVRVDVNDTDIKRHTISFDWDGQIPLLTSDFVERTAKITEIKIRPNLVFYEIKELYDQNGFVTGLQYNQLQSGYQQPKEYFVIKNPTIPSDPLSAKYYKVFEQWFAYPSSSSLTNSILYFGLTDNLRANAYIDEPNMVAGMKGFYFTSLSIVMTLEGTKKDYEQITEEYGEEDSDKTFHYEGNELFQTTNTHSQYTDDNKLTLHKYISDIILEQYESGKETMTLRCSFSDYFYNDGIIAIKIDDAENKYYANFEIGNTVIPMVKSSDGFDHPISQKIDGSAKEFRVVGTRCIYDGAVWQELTLQEV